MMLVTIALLMISITTATAAESVYINPSSSSAAYGEMVTVEIRVSSETAFQGGQFELGFDPDCVMINGFELGNNFNFGGASPVDQNSEKILFAAVNLLPAGDYLIGELTLECVGSACTTDLAFEGVKKIVDKQNTLDVNWVNACLICTGEDPGSGDVSANVYMSPSSSSASYGEVVTVEVWVSSDIPLQGGQFELGYDPDCVMINDFVLGNDFSFGGASQVDQNSEKILFAAGALLPAGDYLIGKLKLECVGCACTIPLTFEGEKKVVDKQTTLDVNWIDGEFTCTDDGPISGDGSEVYMNPSSSNAVYGEETMVEIRIDANTSFQGGQFELGYDPGCVKINDFVLGSDFAFGGASQVDQNSEKILFAAEALLPAGDYLIGVLKLECVCENESCSTPLTFEGEKKIVDKQDLLDVHWVNGCFSCNENPDGLSLTAGWNFVSVPYTLTNSSFSYIIGDLPVDAVMSYNSSLSQHWVLSMDLMWEPLKGYWIHATEDCIIPAERLAKSLPPNPTEIQLYNGWNAIGHCDSTDTLNPELVLKSIDTKYGYIMGPWDPVEKTYTQCGHNNETGIISEKHMGTDIFEMNPYEGYWLYMNETGVYGSFGC
ncbi:MAG: cohesin domain-containing protein [Methanosarcinaceae archaeon]|nr:cohesin domain-containing protein [Methanosarcinaceae archaeon]